MKKIILSAGLTAAVLMVGLSPAFAERVTVDGTVTDVFGHRYVISSGSNKTLVNVGPRGPALANLKSGDKVKIEGEMLKSGEVRAANISVGGTAAVAIPGAKSWWQRLTGRDGKKAKASFSAEQAKVEIEKAGYTTVGQPTPLKRHFEVLAKKDGKFFEVHAHRDGKVNQVRSVEASDPRWGSLVK